MARKPISKVTVNSLSRTSLYLDPTIVRKVSAKLGGENISAVIRDYLAELVDSETIKFKVGGEIKEKYEKLLSYPNAQSVAQPIVEKALSKAMDEVLDRLLEDLNKIRSNK